MVSLAAARKKMQADKAASIKKINEINSAAKKKAAHPMAKKSQKKSKAPALPKGKPPKGITKKKGYTFTMGKLSLLAVSLSLMLLGAFTFFSGFLLGTWYNGGPAPRGGAMPGTQIYGTGPRPGGGLEEVAGFGAPTGSVGSLGGTLGRESQALGISDIAGTQLGYQAQVAVQSADIPGVPGFLQPFVQQVQLALGGQAGSAASKAVSGFVEKGEKEAQKGISLVDPSAAGHKAGAAGKGGAHSGAHGTAHKGTHGAASGHATGGSGPYTVQLGAYVAQENANSMMERLKMKNFDAYVETDKDRSGQEIHYVRVGHYDSYDTAQLVATQFKSHNIPGATIMKVKEHGKKK